MSAKCSRVLWPDSGFVSLEGDLTEEGRDDGYWEGGE